MNKLGRVQLGAELILQPILYVVFQVPPSQVSFPPFCTFFLAYKNQFLPAPLRGNSLLLCVCQGGVKTWTGFVSHKAHATNEVVAQGRGHFVPKTLVPPLNRCIIKSCAEFFPPLSSFLCFYHLCVVSSGSKDFLGGSINSIDPRESGSVQRWLLRAQLDFRLGRQQQAGALCEHSCPAEGELTSPLGMATLSA